jgi:glycosyltransferase involved in cell wall biosynthesis
MKIKKKDFSIKNFYKISIIVVSLNTKVLFLKTLKSITNQKFKNCEIIVIDGGSTDGTQDLIVRKKIINKYIIEKDQGIYDAMNKGIKLASGQWTIFLNSGDVFFDRNVLFNIFKKKGLKKKDIIFGNTLVKNDKLKYFIYGKTFLNKTIVMPFCHQSSLVKTTIQKINNFSLNYKYSSDFNFFIEQFKRKRIFYSLNLTIATVKAKGISDRNRQKVYSENIKILKKNNYSSFIIAKLFLLKLFNLIKDCIKYIFPQNIILLILNFKYQKRLK